MRLRHPPDGSTSSKYKLLCFKTTKKICKVKNALAFNRDRCCHLVLCLRLIPFHCVNFSMLVGPFKGYDNLRSHIKNWRTEKQLFKIWLKWYDNAKVGIFVNFGIYSVPGFESEWFWCYWKCPDRIKESVVKFMQDNFPPNFTYQDFASQLK